MKKWLFIIVVVILALNIESADQAPASPQTEPEEAFFADTPSNDWRSLDPPNIVYLMAEEDMSNALPAETNSSRTFPEPATMFLLGMGLMGMASFKKRLMK